MKTSHGSNEPHRASSLFSNMKTSHGSNEPHGAARLTGYGGFPAAGADRMPTTPSRRANHEISDSGPPRRRANHEISDLPQHLPRNLHLAVRTTKYPISAVRTTKSPNHPTYPPWTPRFLQPGPLHRRCPPPLPSAAYKFSPSHQPAPRSQIHSTPLSRTTPPPPSRTTPPKQIEEREREREAKAAAEMVGNGAAAGAMLEEAVAMLLDQEAAVAAPAFDIWSLLEAQIHSVRGAPGALVRVRCLRVRNAAAMEALLLRSVRVNHWNVANLQRVAKLAVVDRLLSLGVDAHLRIVSDNPHDRPLLTSFRDWAWELQNIAKDVRGDFYREVSVICRAARKVAAAGFTRSRTDQWMIAKLRDIEKKILRAKAATVLFAEDQQA